MTPQSYFKYTGIVFMLVALLHGMRVLNGWELAIDGAVIPMWVSVLGAIFTATFAYHAHKFAK